MLMQIVDEIVTQHRCPSGLRSRTQDAMWQHSRVQIPLCAFFTFHINNHPLSHALSFYYACNISVMGNPYIYYLVAKIINTYFQSYFLRMSWESQFDTKDKTKRSISERLLDDIEPQFAQFGKKLQQQNQLIPQLWRYTKNQIISKINKFFGAEPSNKHTNQREVANSEGVKNDPPIRGQLSPSLDDKFANITKEIMNTRAILELKSEHQESLQKLQKQLSQANSKIQQYNNDNQSLKVQLDSKSEQLQIKQGELLQKLAKIRELSQQQGERKAQFQLLKSNLRAQYVKDYDSIKQTVQQRIKSGYNIQITRITLEKQSNKKVDQEKIRHLEQQNSVLEEKIKDLQQFKGCNQTEEARASQNLSDIKQKYNNLKDKFQINLRQELKKNKDQYQRQIKKFKQEQQRLISDQMNNWFAEIKAKSKDPLEVQIQKLKQKIQNSSKIEEQLKNTKRQLQNSNFSLTKKSKLIQSNQQNQKFLKTLINKKEELIKKIAELILQDTQRINEDNVYKKIEAKLKSNHEGKLELQQTYEKEKKKYDDLFKQLNDLKGDIRNINSTLLESDDINHIPKVDIKIKFTCRNPNHINLLSKYYQRIINNLNKKYNLTKDLHEKESKLQKLQLEYSEISQRYAEKNKQLNDLQASFFEAQRQKIKNQQKQANQFKILKNQKDTFEAQKIQLSSQLSVKELLVQRINKELSEAKRKITQQEDLLKDLQKSSKSMKIQVQRLNQTNSSVQNTISKFKSENKRLESQLLQVQKVQQSQVNSLQQAVILITENNQARSITNFDSLLRFLHANRPTSKSGPFALSYILQNLYKQQEKLQQNVKKFLQVPRFNITSSYRYDEFNKNFSNYLPLKSSFHFIILVRSKKGQIFGAISTGIGKSQRACIFNLNNGKAFESDREINSTVYDSGFLMFGQGEMRMKNNANLQAWVNSKIFNTRCFTFKRDEIIGPNQEGDSVELSGLEVHRIEI